VADAGAYTLVVGDLEVEHAALDAVVTPLDDDGWNRPTPAEDWTIRDQITHLTFYDEKAIDAITDGVAFRSDVAEFLADPDAAIERSLAAGRAGTAAYLLARWRQSRDALVRALRSLDPGARVPWYGPDMSAMSFATARLMETWAHGQDIHDALGLRRAPTPRLRHIAHLGVATFGHSFRTYGREVPVEPVRVELTSVNGEEWSWGPPGAADTVRGPALDFCLVVTQRRHLADTNLDVTGPVARAWMEVAQAYAGPAGGRREAGQFAR
jgi:uncharacterized protein (TIGR03084 family)